MLRGGLLRSDDLDIIYLSRATSMLDATSLTHNSLIQSGQLVIRSLAAVLS